MSETQEAPIGAVVWRDLTVDNAARLVEAEAEYAAAAST